MAFAVVHGFLSLAFLAFYLSLKTNIFFKKIKKKEKKKAPVVCVCFQETEVQGSVAPPHGHDGRPLVSFVLGSLLLSSLLSADHPGSVRESMFVSFFGAADRFSLRIDT
jgi:hypothetical protein